MGRERAARYVPLLALRHGLRFGAGCGCDSGAYVKFTPAEAELLRLMRSQMFQGFQFPKTVLIWFEAHPGSAGWMQAIFAGLAIIAVYFVASMSIRDAVKRQAKEAKAHKENLARTIHAELADLVARCCFDSERVWQNHWSKKAPSVGFDKTKLRCFAPAQPTIFSNASGDLALLGENVPLRLVQFYNGLSALRRDIHDITEGMTNHPATQPQSQQVAQRFFLTLRPGLDALLALAHTKADDVEQAAIQLYDDGSPDVRPPVENLQDRIRLLLQKKSSERARQ